MANKSCTSCAKKDKEIKRLRLVRVIRYVSGIPYSTEDMLNIKC